MEWKQASIVENGTIIPERWVYLHYYEAYNLLFRIENALRIFVYIVLKDHLKDKWFEADVTAEDGNGTINSLSKRRMNQAQTFGYLGHPIVCPIMHLNSGELTRLIVSDKYWKHFKPHFLGSKDIIKNKFDEVGSIRNSLAHFRPIRLDDVDVLKQNSKQFLHGIEKFLNQVLIQTDVIPTNTQHEWYRELKTLGTDLCVFNFHQSADEEWVRISIQYGCPIINKGPNYRNYAIFNALSLKSSAVLRKYPEIAKDICYLSESVHYPQIQENNEAVFGKTLYFVLSRTTLENQHKSLKNAFEDLLLEVSQETELIQQDHLARGELIHSASVKASLITKGDQSHWEWNYQDFFTVVLEDDPTEYWGNFNYYGWSDFISATDRYPWMPEPVSIEEFPF